MVSFKGLISPFLTSPSKIKLGSGKDRSFAFSLPQKVNTKGKNLGMEKGGVKKINKREEGLSLKV